MNTVKKEVQHEIEIVISESKYQLTTLILRANIELLNYKSTLSIIENS